MTATSGVCWLDQPTPGSRFMRLRVFPVFMITRRATPGVAAKSAATSGVCWLDQPTPGSRFMRPRVFPVFMITRRATPGVAAKSAATSGVCWARPTPGSRFMRATPDRPADVCWAEVGAGYSSRNLWVKRNQAIIAESVGTDVPIQFTHRRHLRCDQISFTFDFAGAV